MVFRKLQRIAAPAALLLAAGGMASCTAHHPGADISMPVGATSRDWPWFDRAVGPTQIYRNFDHGFHYATWTVTKAHALHPNAPRYDYSFNIPPADVAAGKWDARISTFVASTPRNTILSIWHEPEQEIEHGLYTAAQFRAMMVRFKGLVDAQNTRDKGSRMVSVVLMVSTFTGFKGRDPNTYWPGNAGADLIAVDAYGSPSGTHTAMVPAGYTDGRNWKTSAALLTPVHDFAVSKGTRWGVSEFGYLVDVDNPTRKARTITDGVAYARSHSAVMFEYYDSSGSRADWRLRYQSPRVPSTSDASDAVKALRAAIAGS
jgi:hypothetical protein